MAIEYMVDLACPAKEALTVDGLQVLLKAKSQGDAVQETLRRAGDRRAPEEVEIEVVRRTPEGARPANVSLRDLLAAGDTLARHGSGCSGCPGNVLGVPFGCYGTIPYPIEQRTESWLVSLLPDDLSSTAGIYLTSAVEDFEYDGAPVASLRSRGGTFFESEEAEAVSWRDDASRVISADQLLQMMFFVGALQPPHCLMVALFCGILPHDLEAERIALALQDGEVMRNLFVQARIPDGPRTPQVSAFRSFFDALLHAAMLERPLLIDA